MHASGRVAIVAGLPFLLAQVQAARAADPEVFFENEIRPLLVEHCIDCHGSRKSESGLRLDTREHLLRGGQSGAVVDAGKPGQSLLVRAIRHDGELKMPPRRKLEAREIQALERWVELGLPWPRSEIPSEGGAAPKLTFRSGEITDEERSHWSFQPVVRPDPPQVRDTTWCRTPIDRFILAKLERQGLAPMPDASRRALLRRVSFDLVGLPPTPQEIEQFLGDRNPGAFQRVVERLLRSPHYGERWGRHWLDVARYADTAGETADYPVPLAWKYRNWVIDAFNADKPYDQFLREQIAGDLIARTAPRDRYADLITATGFLAISRRFGFGIEEFHYLTIQDTIDTTGQAVLGLTLGCARCHDHKFDPINADDYYAWYGIFDSSSYSLSGDEKTKKERRLHPDVPPEDVARRALEHRKALEGLEAELSAVDAERELLRATIDALGGSGATPDPGFELQVEGAPPGAPWTAHSTARVVSDAQSPYQNVHVGGDRGISFPGTDENNHFGQKIVPPRDATSTAKLYFNIDFRNLPQPDGAELPASRVTGAYRFYLGNGPGLSAAVELGASTTRFLVRDGKSYREVRELELGRWYNLRLELDLRAKSYSGTIGFPGSITKFENVSFAEGWNGVIDQFFVDSFGPIGGVSPARQFDNYSVRTTPIPAPGGTRARTAPEKLTINLASRFYTSRRLSGRRENDGGHEGVHVFHPTGKALPIVGMNTSSETRKVPGTALPGKVVVHPDQQDGVGVAWRSPIDGRVRLSGNIRDAHDCGDSVVWHIDHVHRGGFSSLASGAVEKNGTQDLAAASPQLRTGFQVERGDYLQLIVLPKTHYGCDLTQIEWSIEEVDGGGSWNLEEDLARSRFASNPAPDRAGNPSTWTFFVSPRTRGREQLPRSVVTISANEARARRERLEELEVKAKTWRSRVDALRQSGPYGLVYGVVEKEKHADAAIHLRGDPKRPGRVAPRRNLTILGGEGLQEPGSGSGRLDLAHWLTRPDNPLTARVLVNRIWLHHFGRGIVETPNDFGARGRRPSHPELLDWLAAELVASGWSIKHMHRLILNSRVYRIASRPTSADETGRPQAAWLPPAAESVRGDLFGRFLHRRLEAEAIRDAMLAVSGRLDRTPAEGHPFPPSKTWGFSQHAPFYASYRTNRRSVYLMTQRLQRHPFLTLFDGADTNASTARRSQTTTPPQALYLLNSAFVHDQGAAFAERLRGLAEDDETRLRRAFEIALGRPPDTEDVRRGLVFLSRYRARLEAISPSKKPPDERLRETPAWNAFARTLLVRNDFLFVE